jgi:hypothetical protein
VQVVVKPPEKDELLKEDEEAAELLVPQLATSVPCKIEQVSFEIRLQVPPTWQ